MTIFKQNTIFAFKLQLRQKKVKQPQIFPHTNLIDLTTFFIFHKETKVLVIFSYLFLNASIASNMRP